jgi:trk system potassium uptake protein
MKSGGWAGAAFGRFQHPAQVIATGFGTAILLGTIVLALPIATESGKHSPHPSRRLASR